MKRNRIKVLLPLLLALVLFVLLTGPLYWYLKLMVTYRLGRAVAFADKELQEQLAPLATDSYIAALESLLYDWTNEPRVYNYKLGYSYLMDKPFWQELLEKNERFFELLEQALARGNLAILSPHYDYLTQKYDPQLGLLDWYSTFNWRIPLLLLVRAILFTDEEDQVEAQRSWETYLSYVTQLEPWFIFRLRNFLADYVWCDLSPTQIKIIVHFLRQSPHRAYYDHGFAPPAGAGFRYYRLYQLTRLSTPRLLARLDYKRYASSKETGALFPWAHFVRMVSHGKRIYQRFAREEFGSVFSPQQLEAFSPLIRSELASYISRPSTATLNQHMPGIVKTVQQWELLRLAYAARFYQQEQGEFPRQLAQLIPEYLDEKEAAVIEHYQIKATDDLSFLALGLTRSLGGSRSLEELTLRLTLKSPIEQENIEIELPMTLWEKEKWPTTKESLQAIKQQASFLQITPPFIREENPEEFMMSPMGDPEPVIGLRLFGRVRSYWIATKDLSLESYSLFNPGNRPEPSDELQYFRFPGYAQLQLVGFEVLSTEPAKAD